MAAPKFAQAPRAALVLVADALAANLITGDIAAGIAVEQIRIFRWAGTTAGDVLLRMTDGVTTCIIDEIPTADGDVTVRSYDGVVLPTGWSLTVQHPALAAGSLDVTMLGAELG